METTEGPSAKAMDLWYKYFFHVLSRIQQIVHSSFLYPKELCVQGETGVDCRWRRKRAKKENQGFLSTDRLCPAVLCRYKHLTWYWDSMFPKSVTCLVDWHKTFQIFTNFLCFLRFQWHLSQEWLGMTDYTRSIVRLYELLDSLLRLNGDNRAGR